mmetsp:Transcript_100250/g.289436  ORF Transcript_100250/g.289436 Transcript_100250/m.289436 type:complete len:268 (-) Transcript_100250:1927-2730(-)
MALLRLVQRPIHQIPHSARLRASVDVGHALRDLLDVQLRALPRDVEAHLFEAQLTDERCGGLHDDEHLHEPLSQQVAVGCAVIVPDVDDLKAVDDLVQTCAQHVCVGEDEAAPRQVREVAEAVLPLRRTEADKGLGLGPLPRLRPGVVGELGLPRRVRMVPLGACGPSPLDLLRVRARLRADRREENRLRRLRHVQQLVEVLDELAQGVGLTTLVPTDGVLEKIAAGEEPKGFHLPQLDDALAPALALLPRLAVLLHRELQRLDQVA